MSMCVLIYFKTNHVEIHKSTPLLSTFSCSEKKKTKTWFEIVGFWQYLV